MSDWRPKCLLLPSFLLTAVWWLTLGLATYVRAVITKEPAFTLRILLAGLVVWAAWSALIVYWQVMLDNEKPPGS